MGDMIDIPPADYSQIVGYFVSVRRVFTRKRVNLGGWTREFVHNADGELVAEGRAYVDQLLGWNSTRMRADVAADYWENHHQRHKAHLGAGRRLGFTDSGIYNMGAMV